jgi:hypothetical protein
MGAGLVVLALDPLSRAADFSGEQLESMRGAERVAGGPMIRPEALRSAAQQLSQHVGVDDLPLGQEFGQDDEGVLKRIEPAGHRVVHRFSSPCWLQGPTAEPAAQLPSARFLATGLAGERNTSANSHRLFLSEAEDRPREHRR